MRRGCAASYFALIIILQRKKHFTPEFHFHEVLCTHHIKATHLIEPRNCFTKDQKIIKMEKPSTLTVSSPNIQYTDDFILSNYEYEETLVTKNGTDLLVSHIFLRNSNNLKVLVFLFCRYRSVNF